MVNQNDTSSRDDDDDDDDDDDGGRSDYVHDEIDDYNDDDCCNDRLNHQYTLFYLFKAFSSKFHSNSSPRCKGPITLDEFEWQNNEFVWENDEFDSSISCLLSGRDELQSQLTNLNAEFPNLIDKKQIWMTIMTKLNLGFERRKFLRTKVNWKLMKLNWRGDENGRENL